MTAELTALALAALLQAVQFILYSITAQRQVGSKYAASPRDEPRQLTGTAGRLQRALDNHFEGLILFTVAVVVVTLSDGSTAVTQMAAWVYLAARILYVPAYAFGWTPGRSLIWIVGFLATLVMLVVALL
ncbi:MAPEG family protein [Lutimaribacter sp. EGI FJ00015]|uniref:MAPEG family protein n=1 Tax=Lutimaribacter degradans TaxID=2945989 RepID=A0ACC5ZZ46_9RHOB|nr:MAPEG family protein [Lutimaribacter sp. EGI FJ00013]MCM2563455.1 MAPEG family protein [Lutimaribacter sp. EGI FJ00013]MCO0614635.1 MAPEG family protein [Lutimaribacter sp. EGI FJ00015]MCO0637306.1 MAPEG family protein [Lutimaribacter sp. EGI FJ00014]